MVMDIPHLILFVVTWLLPWRGAVLTAQLRQREERKGQRCLAMVEYADVFWSRFVDCVLVRVANDIMKAQHHRSVQQDPEAVWAGFWGEIDRAWRSLNDEANN